MKEDQYKKDIDDFNRQRLDNKITCLEVYKREIGSNRLLSREELLESEKKLLDFKKYINQISKNEFMKLVVEMDEKYYRIQEFDFFGSKFFVNIKEYRDDINYNIGKEEFIEKYLDLGKEIILIDKYCDYNGIYVTMDDIDLDFMKSQFKEEENNEFFIRLKKGYDHYLKNYELSEENSYPFEDEIVKIDIHPVRSISSEKQVTLKKTKEYGIVELFSDKDKSWTTYYLTDEDFKNKQHVGMESENWGEKITKQNTE